MQGAETRVVLTVIGVDAADQVVAHGAALAPAAAGDGLGCCGPPASQRETLASRLLLGIPFLGAALRRPRMVSSNLEDVVRPANQLTTIGRDMPATEAM